MIEEKPKVTNARERREAKALAVVKSMKLEPVQPERAESEFRDYCAAFLEGYRPPPKRKPRNNCPHGKPLHQSCYPCERERDLKTIEQINAGTYIR